MKSELENIPNHLFDWMEKYEFSSLDPARQAEALAYFSADEYNELMQNLQAIRSVKQDSLSSGGGRADSRSAERRVMRKQELLNRFDEHYKKPSVYKLMTFPVALWKAAAVFILFGMGWMAHYILKDKRQSAEPVMAVIDTIYVTKEMLPVLEKIYDTVYIKQQSSPPVIRKFYRKGYPENVQTGNSDSQLLNRELNAFSIKEADSTPNLQQSSSIKDDSLLRKYPFVSIL